MSKKPEPLSIEKLQLKLDRQRYWLINNHPFYATLAMGLKDTIVEQLLPYRTACTDGRGIKWDRDFLERLTIEEVRAVIIHETLHCAYGHLWRLPVNAKANIACDYVINDIIEKLANVKLPAGGLRMPDKFKKMCEEEIYNRLPDMPEDQMIAGLIGNFEQPAKDAGQDQPQAGGAAALGADTLREEWERRVIQAKQMAQAQGRGDFPGDLETQLERITREKPVDWKNECHDFIRNTQSGRNDWSRLARRHMTAPTIIPRRKVNDVGLLAIFRDTSGSITDELCAEFTAFGLSAQMELNCRAVWFDVDVAIQAEYWVDNGELPSLRAKGKGGTDFSCVAPKLADMVESGEEISGVIFFSDCYAEFGEPFGEVPTLWLSTTDKVAPYGRTVKINV